MILLIDNYDSFTYNLVHYVEEHDYSVKVFRNDKISINEIKKINPDKIIISPGPCTPNEAGICNFEVCRISFVGLLRCILSFSFLFCLGRRILVILHICL